MSHNINNGGTFTTGPTDLHLLRATGAINIGGGTFNLNGNMTVDGGTITCIDCALNLATGKTLTAQNNAQINLASGIFNIGVGSGTNTLIVSGAGTTFTNSGLLRVGFGGTGILTTESGGDVASTSAGLAQGTSTATGTVTVTGADSTWTVTQGLNIGSLLGGAGTLTIHSGGSVTVGDQVLLYDNCLLTLDDGTLTTEAIDFRGGQFDWISGTLRWTSGSGFEVGAGEPFGSTLSLNQNQSLVVDSQLRIDPGAILSVESGVNAGAVDVFAGGQLFVGGATQQFGSLAVVGGDLVFNNTTVVSGPVTSFTGGAITALGDVTFNDLVDGSGDFYGPGTITFAGGMAPGDNVAELVFPAEVSFEGGVTLAGTNTLFIEIGGPSRGTEYDALDVAGALTLDGALDVSLVDLGSGVFAPALGDSFDILDWASLSGTFDTLNLPPLNADLMWNPSLLYTTGALRVALAGDFNGDGSVDAADYVVWRKGVGVASTPENYNLWRTNFGQSAGSGATAGGSAFAVANLSRSADAAVPEPTPLVLVCLTTAAGLWLRLSRVGSRAVRCRHMVAGA
ncbi:MAG: hypothetical protein L0228_16845 [Planctomycetes bacterium]|nr:hypothetical protein [Planctomycetota bacterium]